MHISNIWYDVSYSCGQTGAWTFLWIHLFLYLNRTYFRIQWSRESPRTFLSGNLENRSVQWPKSMKAAPYPFILSHHLALCISVGFKRVSRQEKSIQVAGEWLADTDTHLITQNPLAASSWLNALLTVGPVKSLLGPTLTSRNVCERVCLNVHVWPSVLA